MKKIDLSNIENFRIPIKDHPLKWKFEDDNENILIEHQDQIIPLNVEAANFLYNFEQSQKILRDQFISTDHFRIREEYFSGDKTEKEIKKWLYQRGIPFSSKVYWVHCRKWAFILTWKMIIKYSSEMFFGTNEVIWDKTLNWVLHFDHNDAFYFGKDRIYNSEIQSKEIEHTQKIIDEAIDKSKGEESRLKYGSNIYKR